MRTLAGGISALILAMTIGAAGVRSQVSHPLVTQAEYERWQTELSNWGRWGKDDELGALNLITPAKRKQAAALVKDGVTVSLARDLITEKAIDVPCPVEWSDDASVRDARDGSAVLSVHSRRQHHASRFVRACVLRRQDVERLPGQGAGHGREGGPQKLACSR